MREGDIKAIRQARADRAESPSGPASCCTQRPKRCFWESTQAGGSPPFHPLPPQASGAVKYFPLMALYPTHQRVTHASCFRQWPPRCLELLRSHASQGLRQCYSPAVGLHQVLFRGRLHLNPEVPVCHHSSEPWL